MDETIRSVHEGGIIAIFLAVCGLERLEGLCQNIYNLCIIFISLRDHLEHKFDFLRCLSFGTRYARQGSVAANHTPSVCGVSSM